MADEVTRAFALTYADLLASANAITVFVTRDATQFLGYGVDAAAVTAYQALITEFEALPTDEELLLDEVEATETKNNLRTELESLLRPFETRAKLCWGEGTANQRKFYIKGMTKLADGDLLINSRRVSREAVEYLLELTPFGLTQAMITALDNKNDAFEAATTAQYNAIAMRDEATNTRVEKANALYARMMELCSIGKTIWLGVNEAFYNDYLVYSLPPGVPLKIQNMAFTAGTNTISWDAELSATSYELVFSLNTPTLLWVQLYLGPNTSYVHVYGPSTILYKCRGINANGNGYWSNVLTVTRP
jgi:hypothetical protein